MSGILAQSNDCAHAYAGIGSSSGPNAAAAACRNSACSGSDKLDRFTETGANMGSLGVFEAKFLMRLMQANARTFDKFGA